MFAVGWGANQFSPMLLAYHRELGLSARTQDVLFGVYALGLVPALLLGGRASDRFGRRPLVLSFCALSPLASVILVFGRHSEVALGVGRLLAGACSGVVFSAAAAWVQELSTEGDPGAAARRAAIALSAGFGAGPLGAALVAQWAPHPLWTPYLLHLVLGTVAFAAVVGVRETVRRGARGPLWTWPRAARTRRFRLVVAPMAPWVFGLASVGGVVLPRAIGGGRGRLRGRGQRGDAVERGRGPAAGAAHRGAPADARRLLRARARHGGPGLRRARAGRPGQAGRAARGHPAGR